MAVVTIKLWILQPWNFLLECSKLKCYLKNPAVTYLSTWLRTMFVGLYRVGSNAQVYLLWWQLHYG